MTEAEVLAKFGVEYQDHHRISPGRRNETRNLLLKLQDHAGKPVHECRADDIKAFMAMQTAKGFKVTTIGKNLKILKPFFSWAWDAEIISAEDYMRIQRISPPRGAAAPQLPRPYTKKDLQRFRAELLRRYPDATPKIWERWRRGTSHFRKVQPQMMRVQIEAIVALALHCGLRRHEILKASIEDVHHDNAYVVVRHGKNGKYREVPHTNVSRAAVQAWLELRIELAPPHDSLWLCMAWKEIALRPMREDRFGRLLATVGPGWELHRFRHTCGTEWLRAIKRIEIVKDLLGHATIEQTLGYAKILRDDLHAEMAKAQTQFEEAVA